MSIMIISSNHTSIGAWVNSKNVREKSTSILYNTINYHARISHKPYIFLVTQEPLFLYGSIVLLLTLFSTILVTMYYSLYVGL